MNAIQRICSYISNIAWILKIFTWKFSLSSETFRYPSKNSKSKKKIVVVVEYILNI